jgi:hypothetical protein
MLRRLNLDVDAPFHTPDVLRESLLRAKKGQYAREAATRAGNDGGGFRARTGTTPPTSINRCSSAQA